MASEEEVVRFIFNGANEMAELMYQLIKWALERREKGEGRRPARPHRRSSGRIAPEDAASFAADLAAAGIGAEYVAQADGGLVYSCDAKHFETLKALTKGYAAKYDAMHPESVDNVYYETLRDWRGLLAQRVLRGGVHRGGGRREQDARRPRSHGGLLRGGPPPENLGYVVKFNAKDASMVERALCELDQAYGHPQSAQDVARAVAGYLPSPAEGVWKREGARSTLEARNAGQDEVLAAAHVYPENGGWHVYGEAAGERFGDGVYGTEREAVQAGEPARGAEGRRARLERRDPAPGSCRARPRRAQGGRLHADHDHGRVGPGREHHGRPNGGGRHPLLPVLRRGGGNRFAHLRVRARRRRQGHRRPLYQIVEGEPQGLHHCALRGLGRVLRSRRDGDGEGRRPCRRSGRSGSTSAMAGTAWRRTRTHGTPKPSSACRCTPRPSWNPTRPSRDGRYGGTPTGPQFRPSADSMTSQRPWSTRSPWRRGARRGGATRSPWDRVPKRPHRSAAKPLPSSTPQHARSEPWSRRTTSSSRATSARRKR